MTSAKGAKDYRQAPPPDKPWQPNDLLRMAEAATYSRLPYQYLRAACADRRLRHHRLNGTERGRILIRRRDLDTFIESLAVEPVTFTPPPRR